MYKSTIQCLKKSIFIGKYHLIRFPFHTEVIYNIFNPFLVKFKIDPMDCSPPGSSVHGDSPGKNAGVGCHVLLQGIFPIQGSNPGLLHCR